MNFFKNLFGNKTDDINSLAEEGTIASVVKLIKMQGEAAKSGDIRTLKTITSALKAHVPSELYIMAGETLPMNEQYDIAMAVSKYKDVLS